MNNNDGETYKGSELKVLKSQEEFLEENNVQIPVRRKHGYKIMVKLLNVESAKSTQALRMAQTD